MFDVLPPVPSRAPAFVRDVVGTIIAGNGDSLPVSAMPIDGTFPTATAQWEKRNIAQEIPVWDTELCIQCGKCVLVCPHAVIRAKVYRFFALSPTPRNVQIRQTPLARARNPALHATSGAGRLHWLPLVRGSLPGEEQERGKTQGHQHGSRRRRCGNRKAPTGNSS